MKNIASTKLGLVKFNGISIVKINFYAFDSIIQYFKVNKPPPETTQIMQIQVFVPEFAG